MRTYLARRLLLVVPTLLRLATVDEEGRPAGRRVPLDSLTGGERSVVEGFVDAVEQVSRNLRGQQVVHVKGRPEKLEVSRSFNHLFRQM